MSSYQIYEFDGVTLPLYDQNQELGTGSVSSSLVLASGGTFDWAGSRRRFPQMAAPNVSGIYAAEYDGDALVDHTGAYIVESAGNRIVTHSGRADLRAQVDAIKAKVGVQGVLRRRRFDDLTVAQWRTARLLDVRERGVIEERGLRARLDCVFESASVGWRAASISSASVLVSAPVGVTGLLPVRDAYLAITASATITAITFTIAAQGVSWSWTGSLAAGEQLVIDDEDRTVRIDGTDAYSGFLLDSTHTADGWLTMAPGLNAVSLSITGTASAATLAWYNSFA